MEINLSEEMIEKITCVAFGRIHDLSEKEKAIKDSIAVGETQIKRKHMHLKEIEDAKADAKEVYNLFFEMMKDNHESEDKTMTTERQIEILMEDGCTKSEAKKYLDRNGVTIFTAEDFEGNFDRYMEEWYIDEDDLQAYKDMIEKKIPIVDWGIVTDEEGTYYIMYEN